MGEMLHAYYEPAPYGGMHAHIISLRGDEYLALVAAINDRADIVRGQKAERAAMVGNASLIAQLDMLARHRTQLREINKRIKHIKQLGA